VDPVTLTAAFSAAASLSRPTYVWLSARLHRRRIESEVRRERERSASLMATISALPPASEIAETTPDGRRVTIKLPPIEAA
jgi:hypothetical protein